MAKNFKTLEAKMPPEALARGKVRARKMLEDMALDELRAACALTQTSLGKILQVSQSEVSKIENRTDMYVSTLASYIHAMGGQLEIRAVFPHGDVRITQFEGIVQREGVVA